MKIQISLCQIFQFIKRNLYITFVPDPVPENKKMQEFSSETLTKAKEYDRKLFTQKEIEQERRAKGDKAVSYTHLDVYKRQLRGGVD